MFARAERVTDSAFLRREIASRMHERLALIKIAPTRILDAGCGEGADLPVLQSRFADAHLLGIDAAPAMLEATRAARNAAHSSMRRLLQKWWLAGAETANDALLCGDFAQLPLSANSIDLVWSNLALHWHPQPDRVFEEWRRVLRTDGLLMFSGFGPDTFKELRTAFAGIDAAAHVLPFVDMHDYGDMLVNAGFSTPVMDMENITVTYQTIDKLFADVRAWGGNPQATRRRGMLGKNAWHQIRQALERNRNVDGTLPLTFEVIYGHAFRPVARKTADGEAIIQWDLPRRR